MHPGRKPQSGRDFAPAHIMRSRMMQQHGMNTLAVPRYSSFSPRPSRAFYQNPHAAGGENLRRIRHRLLGEHERVKQQDRFARLGHRQGFHGPWGLGHRPMAPVLPRRHPVFPRRRTFGFTSPLHRRAIRPMYPMQPFSNRGVFPPRGPNTFHNARFEPQHQPFRRRPYEDDGWSDDDEFTEFDDDESDYLDDYDEDDDSYLSDYSPRFDNGYDDEEYGDGWGAGRTTYQPYGGYGGYDGYGHQW